MKKVKDYRKYFKNYYGIDFSTKYEIHHIDLDHNNNDIDNLMLLPKTLHSKYHMLLNSTPSMYDIFNKTFNAKIHSNVVCGDGYNLDMCKKLIETLEECNIWYDYKLYLDKKIPNIHDIEVN